jgi:hypothetical protein
MAALSRGDTRAANFLFRAAITDPDKLPGKLAESDANINLRIQEMLFDNNGIGDVVYGMTHGTAENFNRMAGDTTLLQRAVKLRLLDNSAGTLDEAIRLTARDLWGDKEVVAGKGWGDQAGLKITVDKGTDPQPLRRGFDALLATTSDALKAALLPTLTDVPFAGGEAQILRGALDNYVDVVSSEGYFTNSGKDRFVFIDPHTGTAVPGPDGEALSFSTEDVLEAGAMADAAGDLMRGEDAEAVHRRGLGNFVEPEGKPYGL